MNPNRCILSPETVQMIHEFNERHELTLEQQWFQFFEEMGEAAEALNRDDPEAFREELADLQFVLTSIVLLEGHDHGYVTYQTALENLEKDGEKDGNKVTKSGVDDV